MLRSVVVSDRNTNGIETRFHCHTIRENPRNNCGRADLDLQGGVLLQLLQEVGLEAQALLVSPPRSLRK